MVKWFGYVLNHPVRLKYGPNSIRLGFAVLQGPGKGDKTVQITQGISIWRYEAAIERESDQREEKIKLSDGCGEASHQTRHWCQTRSGSNRHCPLHRIRYFLFSYR